MMKTMKMRNRKEYKADAAERVAGLVSKKQRLSIVRTLLIAIMFLALPSKTFAQWGFDVSSVEAYINDHKKQRSLLLARNTLEYSNKLLHSYSNDATKTYKELNVDLDKYTRAFDVIDVLYQSLRTSLNVYSTYEDVSDRISDYKKLLDDYNKKSSNESASCCRYHTDRNKPTSHREHRQGRRIPVQERERPGAVCHRSSSMFDGRPASGAGKHQYLARQHREASEQKLL